MGFLASSVVPHLARSEEHLTDWLEGLEEAAAAAGRGQFDASERHARAALAAIGTEPAVGRARLALAVALRGRQRAAEAAEVLATGRIEPGFAIFATWLRADALLHAGHAGAAAQLYGAVAASGAGPLPAEARWREADALLAAGLPAPASRAYQALLAASPRHPSAPGARLSLAQARRALGDDAGSAADLRRLWLDLPDRPEGAAAGRLLETWHGTSGAPSLPGAAERLERAERFLSLARPRPALRELDLADQTTGARPSARSALLRAFALLRLGRYPEAEAVALELRARPEAERAEAPGVELALARVAARAGRTEEASALYLEVARLRPRIPGMTAQQQRDLPEDALYLAAWLPYDAGQYREAIRRLGRFLRDHPDSRRSDDARWFRAWCWYRLGNRVQADRALAALQGGPLAPHALYWRARLATTRERRIGLYRSAVRAAQGGWYGILAAARLRALGLPLSPFSPAPPPRALPEGSPGPEAARALARAEALLALGLRGQALEELDALSRGRAARDLAPRLARLADLAGDPEIPFRMARDHLLPTRRALRWAHPIAYREVLLPVAQGLGLDPFLLLAVMRRESSFRREARSGAAAEGLLQLIPPTSERLATLLGVPIELADRLWDPPVSIAFGAFYLSLLEARFPDPAAVVAAYNAGPQAAASWAAARPGRPLDEWVEDMPYRETRSYVRTVMADYVLYRALQGAGDPAIDPARPIPPAAPGIAF